MKGTESHLQSQELAPKKSKQNFPETSMFLMDISFEDCHTEGKKHIPKHPRDTIPLLTINKF